MSTRTNSLTFADRHQPSLAAGTYDIAVTQRLSGHGGPSVLTRKGRFHVDGPRVSLQPAWIESRFPPPSSDGDHANILPHVVLTRSSLPWERDPRRGVSEPPAPWLAVLLFKESELAQVSTGGAPFAEKPLKVRELRSASTAPAFPGLGDDRMLVDDDLASVIDVPRSLLEDVMPKGQWLRYLAHARERSVAALDAKEHLANFDGRAIVAVAQALAKAGVHLSREAFITVDIEGAEWRIEDPATQRLLYVERSDEELQVADESRAAVVSCRLTEKGVSYRAFLVSLDQRFREDAFDYQNAAPETKVRLVVLDRWSFSVAQDAGHLEDLLKGLVWKDVKNPDGDCKPLHLAIPTTAAVGETQPTGGGVPMLQSGFALLKHRLRSGGQTWSWYRGPLVRRVESWPSPVTSVHASDQLLVRDVETGLIDISYAAAWELGRQLTIANPNVALQILSWKTELRHARHRSIEDQRSRSAHLYHRPEVPAAVPIPAAVESWLCRLARLDGVPFGYLVPDPSMLPVESLRVFRVDVGWLTWLINGALSAGRLLGASALEDQVCERLAREAVLAKFDSPSAISGCLIRSEVVFGWPSLHIEGHLERGEAPGINDGPLPILRRATVSTNVIVVLFHGQVGWIDLHPNAEAMHHGVVEFKENNNDRWRFPTRHASGQPANGMPLKVDEKTRVLDFQAASSDGKAAATQVAIALIAGVPRVLVKVYW